MERPENYIPSALDAVDIEAIRQEVAKSWIDWEHTPLARERERIMIEAGISAILPWAIAEGRRLEREELRGKGIKCPSTCLNGNEGPSCAACVERIALPQPGRLCFIPDEAQKGEG